MRENDLIGGHMGGWGFPGTALICRADARPYLPLSPNQAFQQRALAGS